VEMTASSSPDAVPARTGREPERNTSRISSRREAPSGDIQATGDFLLRANGF
jgi:hypothetical protein